MTNNEILQADLLDIIFENRNKEYGAYALRRNYNHRLFLALAAASSVILFFVLINVLGKKDETPATQAKNNDNGFLLHQIVLPKEPEKPKEPLNPKPVEKVATIKYNDAIKIKPDNQVTTTMTEIKDLIGKQIDNVTSDGKIKDDKVQPVDPLITSVNGTNTGPAKPETFFDPTEREPEFPGGQVALMRFLQNNLYTPGELQAGEKKMVQVRFKVDKDGFVSALEVLSSGGNEFDREVIRVCKRMPRWKPAIQNGVNVPVSYVLPVTFIGVEQ